MPSYPKLKLTYFNFMGRAEATRLALYIGGVPFEDHRLTMEQFAALKPSLPAGQVPVLEVDGKVITQSQAILRFAGRLANLYPINDPKAALKIDEILNGMEELADKIAPSIREEDPVKRKEMREELASSVIPRYLKSVDARLAKLKECSAISSEDVLIHELDIFLFVRNMRSGRLDHIPSDIAESYKHLVAVEAKVAAHPKVKEWYASARMSTPKLKLTYFPFPGRAEPIRLALHIAGMPFEDEHIGREELDKRRESLPFGQVPVLEVDGELVAQSLPILRYVGSITGLYPANDVLAALRVDEIFSILDEVYNKISPTYRITDREKQLAMRKVLADVAIPNAMKVIDERLAASGGKFVTGEKLSVGDLAIHGFVMGMKRGNLDGIPTTVTDAFTRVSALYNAIEEHPKVKDWNAKKTYT
ncbi:hypothetical protein ATCC90586_001162 [Pythium insidiosum]|nr:hypothetical protein ATCC90586_001162 [Pythium insidiosum]